MPAAIVSMHRRDFQVIATDNPNTASCLALDLRCEALVAEHRADSFDVVIS